MFTIANLITACNLFFGCIASLMIIQEHYWSAFLCILGAMIADFLDGFIARALHQESPLGVQLDSLADIVSFGLVPGLICYQLLMTHQAQNSWIQGFAWISFLLPIMAAFRLARFNIETQGASSTFSGLPVPAMALFFCGLLTDFIASSYWSNLLVQPWFIVFYILVFSWLMISRLPIIKFYISKHWIQQHIILVISGLLCFSAAVLINPMFISFIIVIHIIYSLIYSSRQKK